MKSLKTKVLSIALFSFALCIGLHLNGYVVQADAVANDQQAVTLKSTTISTSKVIKVPKKEVQVTKTTSTSEKKSTSSSRGFSGGSTIATGSQSSLIQYAFKFLGKPYVYGASGSKAFDCSGFTSYVYKKFGVKLPHNAAAQSKLGKAISKKNLKAGDLLFFNTEGYVSHVGMYIGNGQFIHASSGSDKVTTSDLSSSYYSKTYVGARRILK